LSFKIQTSFENELCARIGMILDAGRLMLDKAKMNSLFPGIQHPGSSISSHPVINSLRHLICALMGCSMIDAT
jgi:hypothetical protein